VPPAARSVTSQGPDPRLRSQPRPGATLDKLSLPPLRAQPPPPLSAAERPALDEIYGRVLSHVPELTIDPSGPPDETRFSSAPPRPQSLRVPGEDGDRALAARLLAAGGGRQLSAAEPWVESEEDALLGFADEVALSEAEVSVRAPLPVLPSARPEPPAPDTLASLPLFPLFAELPREALSRMIAGSQLIELPHDAYVLRKGDVSDALYGIADGSVTVIVPGQQFELTLAEGDVFGESALLDEDRSHADVIVMGQLTALRVPRDVLLDIIETHPPLAGLVLELLTRRLLGNLLQVSPLFQEFDPPTKSELARLFEVRRVAAGTMLAVVGKKMDGLYISLTGTLRVNQPGAPERVAPPGSMFGQNTLLTQGASQVDVITRVDMIVLRLPAARFSRVAMQYPTMLARLAELSTSEVVRVTI
jgi:CRP-like cAMP-binding protein